MKRDIKTENFVSLFETTLPQEVKMTTIRSTPGVQSRAVSKSNSCVLIVAMLIVMSFLFCSGLLMSANNIIPQNSFVFLRPAARLIKDTEVHC